MFSNPFFHSSLVRFSLIAVMLSLGVFIGAQLTGRVEAAPPQSTTAANILFNPDKTSATVRFNCQISEVDEWVDNGNSVLIGCNPGDGAFAFFSQPTTDSKRAARILSIALTAVALGKPVWIEYDPANTNVVGCGVGNCRPIYGMGIYNP